MVKKANMDGEDKGSNSQTKIKNKQQGDMGMEKESREGKGRGHPGRAMDLRDGSR